MADKPPDPVRVLIVEDSIDLAEVLRGHLETLGCEVTVASTPKDALAKIALKRTPLELVLLDRALPDGNGAKVAAKIPKTAKVTVAATGGTAPDLPTPISRDQLRELIAGVDR